MTSSVTMASFLVLFLACVASVQCFSNNISIGDSRDVSGDLRELLQQYEAVGLAAYGVKGDKEGSMCAFGSAGERIHGSGEALVIDEFSRYHIGSNTKSMTATLFAILMEKKVTNATWSSRLSDVLPGEAENTPFENVTMRQLVGHLAGFPHDSDDYLRFNDSKKYKTLQEQRKAAALDAFSNPPINKPGTTFNYSNIGFIIAGHIVEVVSGMSWEEALAKYLYEPLGIDLGGFTEYPYTNFTGAPDDKIDPFGHFEDLTPCDPSTNRFRCDNVPYYGPCGTFSGPTAALQAYYSFHLRCHNGVDTTGLLSQKSCIELHSPADKSIPEDPGYWYGFGWGITHRSWAGGDEGLVFTHAGSNGLNYHNVWVAPGINRAFVSYTNSARDVDFYMLDSAIEVVLGSSSCK